MDYNSNFEKRIKEIIGEFNLDHHEIKAYYIEIDIVNTGTILKYY